ncbi:MAG: BT4734/BF3469 family protein, partial [Nanoarchaeota archaeon]
MNPVFNYYEANIKKSHPLGSVTLEYVINAIRNPKKDIRYIFEAIKKCEELGDMKTKADLKTKLYSFTPCVFVKGSRKYSNIQNWTGILMLDFDHLENESYCSEFKHALFNKYDFIITSWLTASRHGVRALVKIPICTSVDEFKQYFAAIALELSLYKGFDTATKNCILPMFISYDTDVLHRKNPSTWTKKFIAVEQPIIKQYIVTNKSSTIEKIMITAINKITGNGHPQLRAAAYSLGGYIGAGYIDYDTAIQIINNLIDSNAYLKQKESIYKGTAKT